MKKVLGILVLISLLALPGVGMTASLEDKIEALSRQTLELQQQLQQLRQQQEQQEEALTEIDESIWNDMNSRFQWSGDFRTRYDYYSRDRYTAASPNSTTTEKNKSLFTNRLRLNMHVKALENVEFVGRLAMYKAWGMQNTPTDQAGFFGGYPAIDGNSGRTPNDNTLLVDRAIVNWTGIGGSNFWLSLGRRPTTDGPPSQLRQNSDSRMATPVAYMDWPFDGATLGYAYDKLFGVADLPGRIRFCYGRGYEAGLGENTLKDTDFAGISWDIYNKNNRFVYLQSYVAKNVFNYPDISDANAEAAVAAMMGPRDNIGDIYHTSLIYMDKIQNFHYFINGAWSRTDPNSSGMFNDPIAMMMGGAPNTSSENGYSVYVGTRYDIPRSNVKIGLEYNYGSEYWIGMSPGHDDMYASKLATRGHVFEIYGIYDLPGQAVAKLGSAFFRVGYQHYRYNYTGSLDWNMRPYDIGSSTDRATVAMFGDMGPLMVKTADQVYVSFDVKF